MTEPPGGGWDNGDMPATRRRPLMTTLRTTPWTTWAPPVALVALAATWGRDPGLLVVLVVAVLLGVSVLAAVHHAEVVAHRVGEPFGSIVLAVAVTIIEVGLIVTLMAAGGEGSASLARDTVFAAVMITCNGILGLSLFVSARRHGFSHFNAEGTGGALATVAILADLPRAADLHPEPSGPQFTGVQLAFAAVASLALYGMFIVTQTGAPRLLPPGRAAGAVDIRRGSSTPTRPPSRMALTSLGLLVLSLVCVVGLAKVESPAIEAAVAAVGFPPSFVGVVIALLVLLPGDARRGARRPAGARADEPQPRPRFGDGEHRADDPGARGRLDLARRAAPARSRRDPGRAAGLRWSSGCSPSSRAGPPGCRAASTSCSSRPTSSSPSIPDPRGLTRDAAPQR